MNRLVRVGAFVLGAVVLTILVIQSGPAVLLARLSADGWVVGPLVLLWAVVYAFNTRAWQLLVPKRPPSFSFPRAYLLTVSCFAMNYATPVIALGGEPLKISGATPFLGRHRAVGSVVGFRFLAGLAHILMMLLAIIPAALLLPPTPTIRLALGLGAIVLLAAPYFLLSQHRDGIFDRGVTLLSRLPLLRRLAVRLEQHRPVLLEIDAELTAIHRAGRWHFPEALGVEIAGRIISSLEYALILYSLGLGFDPVRGFVIANLASLFTNIFFFMPFEMGSKEGGAFLIFRWLHLDPALGTSAALLSRLRELVWIAIGLGCLLLAGGGKKLPLQRE